MGLLSNLSVTNAKPRVKVYYLNDGGNLRLKIIPAGGKYFVFRFRLGGKERTLQIGKFPRVTLAQAREKAAEASQLVAQGIDPVQQRRAAKARQMVEAATTFQVVAEQWLAVKARTLAPTTHRKIRETFATNVYPRIGNVPVSGITAPIVRQVLQAMEQRGAHELMWKARQWIRALFSFAENEGLIDRNPVPEKDDVLAKHVGQNMPHLASRADAGRFLRSLIEYPGRVETRIAIWLLMLTAVRPGELRLAQWAEFDLDRALWIIPLERMKNRKHMTQPHAVPLSTQAVAALRELEPLTGYSGLLFPGTGSKPISDMTMTKALRQLWPDYRIVPHGFRHFFSTEANEAGRFRHDVIEAALAHKSADAIRSTYNKAVYLDERRALAQWWADELVAMRDGAKVLQLRKEKV